jgi:hypothetical protein
MELLQMMREVHDQETPAGVSWIIFGWLCAPACIGERG